MTTAMSFWSLQVPPGKEAKVSLHVTQEDIEFVHVTNVALGRDPAAGAHCIAINVDGKETVLATLEKGVAYQHGLDFVLDSNCSFKNYGKSAVHITGYNTRSQIGEMSSDFEDDEDEMFEDDEEDSDEPPQGVPIKGGKKAAPSAAANGSAKQAAKKPAAAESESDDDEPPSMDELDEDDLIMEGEEDDDDEDDDEDEDMDDDDEDEDEDEDEDDETPAKGKGKPTKEDLRNVLNRIHDAKVQQDKGAKRPAAAALTPAPTKKQKGQEQKAPATAPAKVGKQQQQPEKSKGKDAAAAKGDGKPAAAAGGAADAAFQKALVEHLKQVPNGTEAMAKLGSSVKKPEGVAVKLGAFLKSKPDVFKVDANQNVTLVKK